MPLSPHFKVPTVLVLHPPALFSAHLWGVRHSKSAHQAPSITVYGKKWRAKQNSLDISPQETYTFHRCHILTHWLNAISLNILTNWSITLKIETSQCLQTNRNAPKFCSTAGCYTSTTFCPRHLSIFRKPIRCLNDLDWWFRSRCYWLKAWTKPMLTEDIPGSVEEIEHFPADLWVGTLGEKSEMNWN